MRQLEDQSFFAKAYNPILQAAIIIAAALTIMILSKIVGATGLIDVAQSFPWTTAAALLFCFAIFNSIFSLSAKNVSQYWSRSISSFIGVAALNGGLAYLFSGLGIGEAGSYKWIYVVLMIGYLVFLSMMNMMKIIVEFAQKEEWNHPRIRRRKK
ncbi:MAG: hypothetical protein KDC44_09670 [Phaeodactylibacter sp.]|nr:hypothetical protein [Phaeodactylibacter sp.]